jgi:hypothetical protein
MTDVFEVTTREMKEGVGDLSHWIHFRELFLCNDLAERRISLLAEFNGR